MTNDIRIRRKPGKWCIRAGGAVLGESSDVLELSEPGLPDMLYFPRDGIAMALLEKSAKTTTCPKKGEASYYAIHTKSTVIEDAGWSYETPLDAVAGIAGHIAFYPDKVTVEEI
ncbi:DUF427 domain-containing protein [Sinisalibacter aestuarii]|uniref:DUF427 domain-containing protein n=1 Tax=Sinisalibacter aestuarii TaxID=2949426 RepID=A0ABQ5LU66_9RHOB|nr:DUF427 domain-containing protein [Sinisalibacter aestuarii]GKY88534.1 hypothetical protein STA1M1_24030 [Sinisalibacter aestuarii]